MIIMTITIRVDSADTHQDPVFHHSRRVAAPVVDGRRSVEVAPVDGRRAAEPAAVATS